MFKLFKRHFETDLFNEKTFYKKFMKDLNSCSKEVIIESPFITSSRIKTFEQVFRRLLHNKIKIYLVTRDPRYHEDENFRHQATNEILKWKEEGINTILIKGYHHRKLAIIDREILWEGSLNILSHTNSLEFMRRINGKKYTMEAFQFLQLNKFI